MHVAKLEKLNRQAIWELNRDGSRESWLTMVAYLNHCHPCS